MANKKASRSATIEFDDEIELGIESEEDLSEIKKAILERAVVFSTDWTTEVLISQLSKGNVDLDPSFQRRDAWNIRRKSRFIESLIIGIPIPQIVLAEKKNAKGSFIVIDGKQRLLSLLRFSKELEGQPPFALEGLRVRTDLNGVTYEQLKETKPDINAFENQTIRTVIIRNWQVEDLLYLIFHRLNSETLPLSPQELRQALNPGPFLKYCDEHSLKSDALKAILNLNKPDFRMRDIELFVRFIAFQNFASSYKGNLKKFLDDSCEYLNKNWKARGVRIRNQASQFEKAADLANSVFQGHPFRKWEDGLFESRFNRAIFDVVIYFFADARVRTAVESNKSKVLAAFKSLCTNNQEFIRSVESTTKSKSATSARFNHWARALGEATGLAIEPPKIHD